MTKYEENLHNRTTLRYCMGLLARLKTRLIMDMRLEKMRREGSKIGKTAVICPETFFSGGCKNLVIGEHSTIQSGSFDTRAPIVVGKYVIIGSDVSILTCSHDIDSPEWEFQSYGIEIEDYAWVATGAHILPQCRHIGRGAIIGAHAVVASDVPSMAVVVGNPAKIVKYRKCVHENIIPEAFHGGDLQSYLAARKMIR